MRRPPRPGITSHILPIAASPRRVKDWVTRLDTLHSRLSSSPLKRWSSVLFRDGRQTTAAFQDDSGRHAVLALEESCEVGLVGEAGALRHIRETRVLGV